MSLVFSYILMSLCPPARKGSSNSKAAAQDTSRKNCVKNGGAGGPRRQRDSECFGDGPEEDLDTDFDFEGNLALFDKAAVFSKIAGGGSRSNRAQHHSTQADQKTLSYRHDENILQGKPVIYRQITVPQHGGREYCTGKDILILIHSNLSSFLYITSHVLDSFIHCRQSEGAVICLSV